MPRPLMQSLTENELPIMNLLWDEAPLPVGEILTRLRRNPKPAYTSVLTAVQVMEKKGYIRHRKQGKAYIYSPILSREAYEQSEVQSIARRLFGGDPLKLAINLVKNEHLSEKEIKTLKKMLEDL